MPNNLLQLTSTSRVTRPRDNQRSRVYQWETAVERRLWDGKPPPDFSTLNECASYAQGIWLKERGRVGLARCATPLIERPHWGQRRALAYDNHRITLPRCARNRWVILHELAHRLTPTDEAHGPRFVGVLIGLAARWLELDAQQLQALADDMRVKYYVRSIGAVPVRGPAWHVERVLQRTGPMTLMDLACHLTIVDGIDVSAKQVRGAALALVAQKRARWHHKKLRLVEAPPAL